MRIDWGQQFTWVAIFLATLYNLAILWETVTLPFLRGSDLAQADLSLFMSLILVGVPVLIASLAVLSFTVVRISRRNQLHLLSPEIRVLAIRNPLVLIALGNLLVQFLVWAFMLYIMKFGLFAVTEWTR